MAAFGEDVDIDATHAQTMKNRDSIPAGHWLKVVAAAKNRGIRGVNVKALAAIAAEKEAQKKLKEAGT